RALEVADGGAAEVVRDAERQHLGSAVLVHDASGETDLVACRDPCAAEEADGNAVREDARSLASPEDPGNQAAVPTLQDVRTQPLRLQDRTKLMSEGEHSPAVVLVFSRVQT